MINTHTLDLVITNEPFIENIAMLAPLGKSGHPVLSIDCRLLTVDIKPGMKQSIKIN